MLGRLFDYLAAIGITYIGVEILNILYMNHPITSIKGAFYTIFMIGVVVPWVAEILAGNKKNSQPPVGVNDWFGRQLVPVDGG